PKWPTDPEQDKHKPGWDEYPLAAQGFMGQTIHPLGWDKALNGEYKVLIGWTGNPYSSQSDTFKVHKAIQGIPFIAVIDLVMNPLAEQADLVLPVTWWTERNYLRGPNYPILIARQKAHEPPGDQRSDISIALELGKRTDPDKWAQWETEEDLLDWMLEPTGLTFQEFAEKGILETDMVYQKYEKGMMRRDHQPGFGTKTGKVEIYCTTMYDLGQDPIPYWNEPLESPVSDPEMAQEYPLIMTTGFRIIEYLHSEGRQVPWLRERYPECLLEINPLNANELGIKDGDMVYVETPTGKVHIKAKVWNGILPGVVGMSNGWYFPDWQNTASNVLVNPDKRDPVSGAVSMRSFLCKVYK
ncbi:MAG: molybdopterin-dependent oxidoreductase, partial [Anaerolineales bacterium]|nr:molybdopterin-dependent oxidoreductase [Anaerolineales bacterium]